MTTISWMVSCSIRIGNIDQMISRSRRDIRNSSRSHIRYTHLDDIYTRYYNLDAHTHTYRDVQEYVHILDTHAPREPALCARICASPHSPLPTPSRCAFYILRLIPLRGIVSRLFNISYRVQILIFISNKGILINILSTVKPLCATSRTGTRFSQITTW